MSRIIEMTEELAREIASSEEYTRVKTAEDAVQKDQDALALVFDYRGKYQRMTELFGKQDDAPDEFREAARELQEAEDAMAENPTVKEMMDAQGVFSGILQRVNMILQSTLGGGEEGGSSCSGNCESCGQCN